MTRLLFVCIALLTMASAASAQQQPDRDWQACSQNADHDRAIRGCTAVLARGNAESAANRSIALSNRAAGHQSRQNLDAAMADYNEAIRLNPRNAFAFRDRGSAHRERGDNDAAIADYNAAIRINPRLDGALTGRGNSHHDLGNLDAAIADFNEAIRINPRDAYTFTSRGLVHQDRGNHDAAIADFNAAIRLDPRDFGALTGRGNSYHLRGNPDAAIADFNAALRIDPAFAHALISRGNFHYDRGNRDAALADYNAAIRLAPSEPTTFFNRGQLHGARGDLAAALADFRQAATLGHQEAAASATRTEQQIADERARVARLEEEVAQAQLRLELRTCLEGAQDLSRQIAACEAWLQRGLVLPQDRAAVFTARGEARRALGSFADAMADFSEAIRLNPGARAARENRGLLFLDRGDLQAAQADLRRALELGATGAQEALNDIERRLGGPIATPGVVAPVAQIAAAPQAQPSAPVTQPTERRVALVIGNAAYRAPGVAALPNPPRDARAMAALFRELGFAHVALHQDLDQAAMLRALRDFEREAEQADWAVVYFAGHGIEINGANHLVPIDAQLRSDRDVPDEAVPLSRVLSRLEGTRKLRLVILDACRDNPFLPRMQRVATRSITRGLAPIEDAQMQAGTMVAFAARAGQLAEDGTADNSPFVEALNRRMREPNVEINLLFRRVRDDVLSATGRRQEPFTYASLPSEELFLRR